MKPLSIRTRIMLWNTVVLAVTLLVLAVALRSNVNARILKALDGHLGFYANDVLEPFGPRAPEPPPHTLAGAAVPQLQAPRGLPTQPSIASAHSVPGDGIRTEFRHPSIAARLLDAQGRDFRTRAPVELLDARAFDAALGGRHTYVTVVRRGESLRALFRPVEREGRRRVLQLSIPLSEHQRMVWHLTHALVALAPLLLLIAGAGGALITERSLRPVRTITEAAGHIQASNLSERLPVIGRDELSHLSGMLNGMLDRLQCAFEQQRRFTADASHELRTPLAIIKAVTSLRLEDNLSEEDRAAYAAIDRAAARTQRIVMDLLLLARADGDRLPLVLQDVEVGEWIARSLDAMPRPPAASVGVELDACPLLVRGDPEHLLRLLVNLLENADRHTPADGTITLRAIRRANSVRITVEDTGEGIPEEHLPHVCERFYRVDSGRERSGGGAGLGLAICRTIAEAHGGTLTLESSFGKRTTVTLVLPEGGSRGQAASPETPWREASHPSAVFERGNLDEPG